MVRGFLACAFGVLLSWAGPALAQGVACRPANERTDEVGCWVVARQSLGRLTRADVFWHLDAYSTRAAGEAARGPRGTVVEALGKVSLLTIEDAGWRSPGGERVAEIGPLPITAGVEYSAQYMETIFTPGMTSTAHVHAGPEA